MESGAPSNNEMQRTKHGPNGASPLISVLAGPRLALTRHTAGLARDPLYSTLSPGRRVYSLNDEALGLSC